MINHPPYPPQRGTSSPEGCTPTGLTLRLPFRERVSALYKKTVSLHHHGDRGFAMVATILILSVVLAISGIVITLIRNNAQSISGFSDYQTASSIASLGIEKAANSLKSDANWTDNSGRSQSSYLGGSLTLALSDSSTNNIRATATGIYNHTKVVQIKTLTRPTTMALSVTLNTSSSYLTNGGTTNQVAISNTGTTSTTITGIILSWDPQTAPNTITRIDINGTETWIASPSNTPHTAGTILTFETPYTLTTGTSGLPMTLTFDQDMSGKIISLVLQLDDGSSRSITYTPNTTEASFLTVDVSGASITGKKKKDIKDIILTNTHDSESLSITQVQTTWIYNDPAEQIKRIKFDNSTEWSGNEESGETQTLKAAQTLSPGSSDTLDIQFSGDISYSLVEITFTLSDGSTKTGFVDFRINQAESLSVDTNSASINGNKLENIVLQNTHDDAKIWVDSMSISVSPNSAQTVENIVLNSSSIFGPSNDPDDLDTDLAVTRTEITPSEMTQDITFSNLSAEQDFSITYTMRDGSSKTVTRNFASDGPASGSLSGSTYNVIVNDNLDDVENFAVSKNGSTPVSFQKMVVSWDPIGSLKLKEIDIDGTRLFSNSGGVSSGTEVTLSSEKSLTSADTLIDLTFRNDSAADRDITLEFILSDGSRKAFTAFLNPGNSTIWAAADPFETDQGVSGGSGFASNWNISDSSNNTFKSGNNSYSGDQHMRLRQQNTASRTLTNAATKSSQKVSYTIQLKSYDSGESAYLETRIGNGAWTTIRTIPRDTLSNNTFYKFTDTMPMTLGQKFDIRFRGNASNSNEGVYIDDLYFAK